MQNASAMAHSKAKVRFEEVGWLIGDALYGWLATKMEQGESEKKTGSNWSIFSRILTL